MDGTTGQFWLHLFCSWWVKDWSCEVWASPIRLTLLIHKLTVWPGAIALSNFDGSLEDPNVTIYVEVRPEQRNNNIRFWHMTTDIVCIVFLYLWAILLPHSGRNQHLRVAALPPHFLNSTVQASLHGVHLRQYPLDDTWHSCSSFVMQSTVVILRISNSVLHLIWPVLDCHDGHRGSHRVLHDGSSHWWNPQVVSFNAAQSHRWLDVLTW